MNDLIKSIKNPETAWLFDVDGVLTDPEKKIIKHPEIIDEIIKRIQRDEPVACLTGRSLVFIRERVLMPLEKELNLRKLDRRLLSNLYAIGEMGGTWLTYNEKGIRKEFVDEKFATKEFIKMQKEIRNLVQMYYTDIMFFDESKRTMISIEMNDGKKLDEFRPCQKELYTQLKSLIAQHKLEDKFGVDSTRIATDVNSPLLGKTTAARLFINKLSELGIKPQKYKAFGDSTSDFDMGEELHRLGLPVEFIFVGGREHLHGKNLDNFPVIYTQGHCDEGTLEYLQNNK